MKALLSVFVHAPLVWPLAVLARRCLSVLSATLQGTLRGAYGLCHGLCHRARLHRLQLFQGALVLGLAIFAVAKTAAWWAEEQVADVLLDMQSPEVALAADYLGSLADEYGLSSNVQWYARRVHAAFDQEHDSAAIPYPSALAPVDHYPSLTRIRPKFRTRRGFAAVHVPAAHDRPHADTQYQAELRAHFHAEDIAEDSHQRDVRAAALALPVHEQVLTLPVPARGLRTNTTAARTAPRQTVRAPVDASALLIGISTTYARLSSDNFSRIDDWARWLTDGHGTSNGAFLFLSLHRPRGSEVATIERLLKAHGIAFHLWPDGGTSETDTKPVVSESPVARYAKLLRWLDEFAFWHFGQPAQAASGAKGAAKLPPPKTMYALVEDDVFFPNMPRLLAKLREHRGILDREEAQVQDAKKNKDGKGSSSSTSQAQAEAQAADDFLRFDHNLWLGFPSDPWFDWIYHNGSTLTAADLPLPLNVNSISTSNFINEAINMTTFHASSVSVPMSFGGGAVFIAPHLANRISALPCMDFSTTGRIDAVLRDTLEPFEKNTKREMRWDEYLYRCTVQHIPGPSAGHRNGKLAFPIPLRIIPSFYDPHDVIIYGTPDESALLNPAFTPVVARMQRFEGGAQPLVMHHHRTWHGFDATGAHRVVDRCGDDCFLQRFVFRDNWVLVNGYSLTHYPSNLWQYPLERHEAFDNPIFATDWSHNRMKSPMLDVRLDHFQKRRAVYMTQQMVLEHAARPDKAESQMWRGKRETYRLLDTRVAADGSTVMQAYVRRGRSWASRPNGRKGGDRRSVQAMLQHMPIPSVVLDGGLGGSADDMATEASPPDEDEVVVLLWEPTEGDDKGGGPHKLTFAEQVLATYGRPWWPWMPWYVLQHVLFWGATCIILRAVSRLI